MVHFKFAEDYRRKVATLDEGIQSDDIQQEVWKINSSLIDQIILTTLDDGEARINLDV